MEMINERQTLLSEFFSLENERQTKIQEFIEQEFIE